MQPDTIIPQPFNPQSLNRYTYVLNNPLRYTDPSGHEPHTPGSCYESVNGVCGYTYPTPQQGFKPSIPYTPSYGNGLIGPPEPETTHTVYMGGATPAGIYEWQDVEGAKEAARGFEAFPDAFSGVLDVWEMHTATNNSTLQAYLTYVLSGNKSVNKISISIINNGESDATLQYIRMTQSVLPSTNSCTYNNTCQFEPFSPVVISPGNSEALTICQNCLSDGSTIYSHPFPNNRDKQMDILMVLYLYVDGGLNGTEAGNIPFMYSIPRR